jgi:hypothetical protein
MRHRNLRRKSALDHKLCTLCRPRWVLYRPRTWYTQFSPGWAQHMSRTASLVDYMFPVRSHHSRCGARLAAGLGRSSCTLSSFRLPLGSVRSVGRTQSKRRSTRSFAPRNRCTLCGCGSVPCPVGMDHSSSSLHSQRTVPGTPGRHAAPPPLQHTVDVGQFELKAPVGLHSPLIRLLAPLPRSRTRQHIPTGLSSPLCQRRS